VDLLVGDEVGLAVEALAALGAGEGLLAGVDALVQDEGLLGAEALAADGALEGLLAGVDALVPHQVALLAEALAADGAGKGLLPRVHPQVGDEVPPVLEALPALAAGEGTLGAVAAGTSHRLGAGGRGGARVAGRGGFLPSAARWHHRSCVLLQAEPSGLGDSPRPPRNCRAAPELGQRALRLPHRPLADTGLGSQGPPRGTPQALCLRFRLLQLLLGTLLTFVVCQEKRSSHHHLPQVPDVSGAFPGAGLMLSCTHRRRQSAATAPNPTRTPSPFPPTAGAPAPRPPPRHRGEAGRELQGPSSGAALACPSTSG